MLVKKTPVALFVYNRLEHTKRTVGALKVNLGALDTDLIVFSDGPKTNIETQKVAELRDYLKTIEGFKSVQIIESDRNKGLANSIIDGVTVMIANFGQVIILEDDLVTSPYFLQFMNEGLEKYKDTDEVISIHGYTYGVKDNLPETFFLRGADCWGWATWQRGWQHFESDGAKLLEALTSQGLVRAFNLDGANDCAEMLESQVAGKISSWAIRWHASAFLKNKLTLYPGQSLVQNIGVDGSGTHCYSSTVYDVNVRANPIKIMDIPVEESSAARRAFIKYFKSLKPSPLFKLKKIVLRAIGKP